MTFFLNLQSIKYKNEEKETFSSKRISDVTKAIQTELEMMKKIK